MYRGRGTENTQIVACSAQQRREGERRRKIVQSPLIAEIHGSSERVALDFAQSCCRRVSRSLSLALSLARFICFCCGNRICKQILLVYSKNQIGSVTSLFAFLLSSPVREAGPGGGNMFEETDRGREKGCLSCELCTPFVIQVQSQETGGRSIRVKVLLYQQR